MSQLPKRAWRHQELRAGAQVFGCRVAGGCAGDGEVALKVLDLPAAAHDPCLYVRAPGPRDVLC